MWVGAGCLQGEVWLAQEGEGISMSAGVGGHLMGCFGSQQRGTCVNGLTCTGDGSSAVCMFLAAMHSLAQLGRALLAAAWSPSAAAEAEYAAVPVHEVRSS